MKLSQHLISLTALFLCLAIPAWSCEFCVNGRWKPAAIPHSQHAHRLPAHCAGRVRHYYITAECTVWNYAPLEFDPVANKPLPPPWNASPSYRKYRYYQYSDGTFSKRVPQPAWLGILGPVIRGVVGDTIEVTFLNRTDRPLSIHPHGVTYDKDSEGAYYFPNPGDGSVVPSGARYTYVWRVTKSAGPGPGEPSSKVWLYHSHVQGDAEINMGLVGAIIITDPAHARPDGTPSDVDREFVTLFTIFHEDAGLNGEMGEAMGSDDDPDALKIINDYKKMSPAEQQSYLTMSQKYAINGLTFGNLPGLDCRQGEHVRWYLLDLGSEQDLHTPHWHGETVVEDGRRRTDVVEMLPASMKVADMTADNPGSWLFHCHVGEHMMSGMYANYRVLPKGVSAANPVAPAGIAFAPLTVEPAAGTHILGNAGVYHDFGSINPLDNATLTYSFTLRNTTAGPIRIDRIDTSHNCTAAIADTTDTSSIRVFPGEDLHIKLTLDVTGMNDGGFFKNIVIHTDHDGALPLSVQLIGIIQPTVTIEPASINFGDARSGSLSRNGGSVILTLDMDKRLSSGQDNVVIKNVNDALKLTTIDEGASPSDSGRVFRRYRLTLTPDASIGRFTDKITVHTDNSVVAARISDELSEVGTYSMVRANVTGDFSVDQPGVAFGAISQGSGASKDLKLTGFASGVLSALKITCDSPLITMETTQGQDPHDATLHVRLDARVPSGNLKAHLTIVSRTGARAVLPVVAFVK